MQEMQEMWVKSPGQEAPWSRKWRPTPIFLSGKFHGQRSPAGYSPWGHKESDTTEHACNEYIWNLERWHWWTYMQGSNGDRHREQTCGYSRGRTWWDKLRVTWKHTHYHMQNSPWEFALTQETQTRCSLKTNRGGMGWETGGTLKREGT